MTTRNEKKLIVLSNKRARLIARIAKASEQHKATQALRGKLVETVTSQIQTELRIEKKRNAA